MDAAHLDSLTQILSAHGWQRRDQVGRRGLAAAWLLLQHADHDLQKRMLPQVEAAFQRGEVDGQSLALLTDRVRVGEGRPQRYGTQAVFEDGVLSYPEIEDEARVRSAARTRACSP